MQDSGCSREMRKRRESGTTWDRHPWPKDLYFMKNEPVPSRVVGASVLKDHACLQTHSRVRVHWESLKTRKEHEHV